MIFDNFYIFKFPICHFLKVLQHLWISNFLPVLGFSAIEGPRNSRNQHRHGRHCWYVDAGRSFDQPGGQCSCKCVTLPETTLGCHMLLKYTLVEVVKLYVSGQFSYFHQPRFPWYKGISLPQLPFWGPRSCEVAIIWPEAFIKHFRYLKKRYSPTYKLYSRLM